MADQPHDDYADSKTDIITDAAKAYSACRFELFFADGKKGSGMPPGAAGIVWMQDKRRRRKDAG